MPFTPDPSTSDDFIKRHNLSLGQSPSDEFSFNVPDRASQLFDPSVLKNPTARTTNPFDIKIEDVYSKYMAGGFSTYQPGVDGPAVPARRFNPLSVFANYTYRISLYMLTPEAYTAFIDSGRKTLNPDGFGDIGSGIFLLAQSGGINNTDTNRAPSFNRDYYIDNLRIRNLAANTGTKDTTAGVYEMSFNIVEPIGFTFLSDLKRASNYIQERTALDIQELQNPLRQLFVLGISFVGYDDNGNVVDGNNISAGFGSVYGDNLAINDRYLDIEITEFKFKLEGKPVRYDIKAKARPALAFTSKRGRIVKEISVAGTTIQDILKTGTNSLMVQLNKLADGFVDGKQAKVPTKYDVVFVGPGAAALANAKLVTQASINQYNFNTLVSRARQPIESTDALSLAAEPEPDVKTYSFTQNTSIVQAIEDIIKSSEYMAAAMKVLQENTIRTNPEFNSIRQIPTQSRKAVSWFSVSSKLSTPRYDTTLKDWQYDITYVIETYSTPAVASPFVKPDTKWYGHHKTYEYWFTGKNTEVLGYELNFDAAYFISQAAPAPFVGSKTDISDTANDSIAPVSPGRKTPGSNTNSLGAGLEAQNHYAKTTVFDPGAMLKAKINIMGDPDYISTGGAIPDNQLYSRFYESDSFTISTTGGHVYLDIIFYEGVDYNEEQGILDINDSIMFFESQVAKNYTDGVSHLLIDVESVFSQGKFTQTLNCTLTPFDLLAQAATDPDSRDVTQDQASGDGGQESTTTGLMGDDPLTETDTNNFGFDFPQTFSPTSNEDKFPNFANFKIEVNANAGREPDFNFNTGGFATGNRFGNPFGGP